MLFFFNVGVIDSFTYRPTQSSQPNSKTFSAINDNQSWTGSWDCPTKTKHPSQKHQEIGFNLGIEEIVDRVGYTVLPAPHSNRSRPSTSRGGGDSQQLPLPLDNKIVNRFPDNHARTRSRPATSAGLGTSYQNDRNRSGNRSGSMGNVHTTRRGGSAGDAV